MMPVLNISIKVACAALLVCVFQSCSTGVENTKKITEKDVQRALNSDNVGFSHAELTIYKDSLPNWKIGKEFYVCDKQARLIFSSSSKYDLDTISFEGKILKYAGKELGGVLDNRATVNILLTDGINTFTYPTAKVIDEFKSSYSIPFLIDMDMINSLANQLENKEVYIKTPIWYDPSTLKMKSGRKFIKVLITKVRPGNKVLPIRIDFTALDNKENAFVWVSSQLEVMRNRDFDSMFSLTDLRPKYDTIDDETWNKIIHGEVVEGMTKDECRLSKGNPKTVDQRPFYDGLKEYWYYDGGSYLIFTDGKLSSFRK